MKKSITLDEAAKQIMTPEEYKHLQQGIIYDEMLVALKDAVETYKAWSLNTVYFKDLIKRAEGVE